MTTTTAAASNGSTDTAIAGKPERLTGMAQVREAEALTAAEMADSPEVRGQAAEALRCLYSAQTYLQVPGWPAAARARPGP